MAASTYNSNNQLAQTFYNATYDNNDDETSLGGVTFTYDGENRMYSSAVTIGDVTTNYTYDGEGRRVMHPAQRGGGSQINAEFARTSAIPR